MVAAALRRFDWQQLRPTQAEFVRMLAAGSAWGIAITSGITGMNLCNYGVVCLDEVAMAAAIAIPAGIFTIGPIAIYGRR